MSNKIIFCGVGQGIPHHTGELENFAQLLSKVKMMDETEWFFLPRLFWSSICPHGRPSDWGWEQRRRKSSCQISARNLGRQTGTKWYQSTRKKYDEALAKKAYIYGSWYLARWQKDTRRKEFTRARWVHDDVGGEGTIELLRGWVVHEQVGRPYPNFNIS